MVIVRIQPLGWMYKNKIKNIKDLGVNAHPIEMI